jgi:hypothetical protein
MLNYQWMCRLSYILQLIPFKIPFVLQPIVHISAAVWSTTLNTIAMIAFTMLQLLTALVCMR